VKDAREEYYDAGAKVAVTVVDVTDAARRLAANHLCGPVSAHYLAEYLAAAALFGTALEEEDETLVIQMKCTGPLGGVTVECTSAGTLRGYTEKKILDDFDAVCDTDPRKVVGAKKIQVVRSVPGRIVSQGLSSTLGGYLSQSLQRNAWIRVEASVGESVDMQEARGIMVEALPDSPLLQGAAGAADLGETRLRGLQASPRAMLRKLGFPHAELKRSTPLSFACRCSPERAAAMLAALPPEERAGMPPVVDITCHMCGRTFSVNPGNA